jgi:hypothetical protein
MRNPALRVLWNDKTLFENVWETLVVDWIGPTQQTNPPPTDKPSLYVIVHLTLGHRSPVSRTLKEHARWNLLQFWLSRFTVVKEANPYP